MIMKFALKIIKAIKQLLQKDLSFHIYNNSKVDDKCEYNNDKLWEIVQNQVNYGTNPNVKKIESKCELFKYDEELIDDVPKIVVGPLLLETGATYYGQWYHLITVYRNEINQERHGFGILIWSDGSKYVGYWLHDKANIRGRLIHSDGDLYEGEWKDDMASGQGKLINNCGMFYYGSWLNDIDRKSVV